MTKEERAVVKELRARLKDEVELGQRDVASFRAKLDQDPVMALACSTDAFQGAARLKVMRDYLRLLDEGLYGKSVRDRVRRLALHATAESISRQSPNGHMDRELVLAYREAGRLFHSVLGRLEP